MNKVPKVVVLLAAYNGEQFIKQQLDSILNQQYVDFSIIISIDKSTDSTLSIVNEYVKEYSNIHILPYGDCYGSAGKNFTRLLCEVNLYPYQYISFADQDDIWLPDKLKRAVCELEKNNADAYSSNVTAFWASGKKKLIKKSYPQVEFDHLFESPGPGCSFLLSYNLTKLIQSHLQAKLKENKFIWMHDWYCYSFARHHGFNWNIDSVPSMLYRQHDSNVVGANSGWKGFIARFASVLNGDGFYQALQQAKFIGQDKNLPIELITSNSRVSMFKLCFVTHKCRRKLSHKVMLSAVCFFFFIKGKPTSN